MNPNQLQRFWTALDGSQIEEAIAICRDAVRTDTNDWRAAAAIQFLEAPDAAPPANPTGDWWRFTGQILESTGDLKQAAEHYQEAVRLVPSDVAAHNNLGLLEIHAGNLANAQKELETAAQLAPNHPTIQFNLGMTCEAAGRRGQAEHYYRRALQLRPEYPDAWVALAGILTSRSRFDEAETLLQRAVAAQAEHPAAKTHLGILAAARGDEAVAEKQLRECLATDASNAAAWFYLSRMPRVRDQLEPQVLTTLADDPQTSAANKIFANFAAANCLEAAGRYSEAFQRADLANRKSPCVYSEVDHQQWVDDLLASYQAPLLQDSQRHVTDDDSRTPIFIVGLPRSGTTLVERIIGRSDLVARGGELAILRAVAERIPDWIPSTMGYPKAVTTLSKSVAERVAQEYFLRADSVLGANPQFTDKTPANFFQIGLIHMAFPNARIIHCQRDPLDVAISCYMQYFEHQSFASRLETIGHYILQYRRVMEHWNAVLPGRIVHVEYEQLAREPEQTARRLTESIGVPWRDSMLVESTDDKDVIATASNWQARQAIYASSIGRWKNYETHLGDLKRMLEE